SPVPSLPFLTCRSFPLPPRHPPPRKWKVLFAGAEGQLVENPRALPRAFVPRSLRYATDRAETLKLLEGIGDFAGAGIVEESPPPEAAGAVEINGQATVEVASYEPQRMTLDITAAGPSLVATSVTAWPGWKLTIDDEPAKLVGYNSAFLAFRVATGRHTAVLRYMPDGFLDGSGITVVTLIVAIVLAWRTGRAAPPRA